MVALKDQQGLSLETGWLCLDFANTLDWHASSNPQETLNSVADLIDWASQVGLIDASQARRAADYASVHPDEAARTLADGIVLREAIYRVFACHTGHRHPEKPDDADLELISHWAGKAHQSLQIRLAGAKFEYTWAEGDGRLDLERPILAAAISAADLLTSDMAGRVGECADDRGCGSLFIDTSKNHSRRWCNMDGCGNRAKARRHFERKQGE
jgi:predicted RNA-binding Zn ribbon-like protein